MKGLIQKVYYPQKKKKKVFQKCKSEEKKSGKKLMKLYMSTETADKANECLIIIITTR